MNQPKKKPINLRKAGRMTVLYMVVVTFILIILTPVHPGSLFLPAALVSKFYHPFLSSDWRKGLSVECKRPQDG